MTKTYRITNVNSGACFGLYTAETEQEARDKMARDAGYRDYEHACEVAGTDANVVVEDITDQPLDG